MPASACVSVSLSRMIIAGRLMNCMAAENRRSAAAKSSPSIWHTSVYTRIAAPRKGASVATRAITSGSEVNSPGAKRAMQNAPAASPHPSVADVRSSRRPAWRANAASFGVAVPRRTGPAVEARKVCAAEDMGSGQNCATVSTPMSTWCAATLSVPMDAARPVIIMNTDMMNVDRRISTDAALTNGCTRAHVSIRGRSSMRERSLMT
mmetsp:Transcript_33233/g.72508  ORF Transcript_33233/g.72508 Transcript_33233/m.72508 type:complete len:207 (-) Transcript_33233:1646-2266(-)